MNNQLLDQNGIYDVYLRKSRADNELEKIKKFDTLQQHEKFLKERAKQLGIKIRKTYREVVSGELIQERPQIQEMLSDIETGSVDGVLVVEVERLTRGDSKDQGIILQTFKYSNTKIITLNKIYDPNRDEDEEYFEFGLFMSHREYKTINRRMQRARIANVLDGKYCGSSYPYGYRRVKIKYGKGFTLEPDPETAPIVKKMFEMKAKGKTNYTICAWLNSQNIPPRRTDIWVPASLKNIFNNPVYVGKIRWNNSKTIRTMKDGKIIIKRSQKNNNSNDLILVEGLHPAIIDEETFNLIQKQQPIKKNSSNHQSELKNPLATLIRCTDCGRIMIRRPYFQLKDQKPVMRRTIPVDKEKLRLCLREHKGNYSLRDIAKALNVRKDIVDHWFVNNQKRFTMPYANKWEELKKLLNIKTTEFDAGMLTYEETTIPAHDDTLICRKPRCTNIGSNLSFVEEAVIDGLKKYVKEQRELLRTYIFDDEENENKITSLLKELDKYNKHLSKAYELVESGIYTPKEFTERTKLIKEKITFLEKEITKEKNKSDRSKIENLLPKIEKTIVEYNKLDNAEEKNNLLKSVISYIDYKKEKGGRGYEKNFKITIYPKL